MLSTKAQERRKHLKLGGGARHFEGTFFLKKNGAFSKHKKGTSCLSQNLGGTCPQCPPVPTSMLRLQRSQSNRQFRSLCTDPLSNGGKGLCNYEPKLADRSRFLEFNLCSITKDHVIMQLQETHGGE